MAAALSSRWQNDKRQRQQQWLQSEIKVVLMISVRINVKMHDDEKIPANWNQFKVTKNSVELEREKKLMAFEKRERVVISSIFIYVVFLPSLARSLFCSSYLVVFATIACLNLATNIRKFKREKRRQNVNLKKDSQISPIELGWGRDGETNRANRITSIHVKWVPVR